MFKIISKNLIQKRTEYINIRKEKQNNHITNLTQTQYIRFCGHYRRNQQETQSIGIHDVLQGLESIIGRFQTRSPFCEFSDVIESFTAKEEDGLTSLELILDFLEAKIFWYNFLEGHNVWGNVRYSSSTHRNVVAILATKAEFLWNVSRIGNHIGCNFEPCSQNILTKNYGKFLLC